MDVSIAETSIGDGMEVFVIAEIGINHCGDFEKGKQLIDAAANAGASAVKLQTYITEKRVPKDSPIFDILKKCELSFDEQRSLFEYARKENILIFSTPFDSESVAFLTEIDVPCYKVASFHIVHTKLLHQIAEQKRPVLLSRGMASRKEIDEAVQIFRDHKVPLVLLHCISAYPVTSVSDLHLRTIAALRERYGCPVGFSDHSQGIEAAMIACAAGASVIEKHFVLAGDTSAPDYGVSVDQEQFARMIEDIRRVSTMLGDAVWEPIEAESGILQFRHIT